MDADNLRLPEGEVIADVDLVVSDVQVSHSEDAIQAAGAVDFLLRLHPDDIARATR